MITCQNCAYFDRAYSLCRKNPPVRVIISKPRDYQQDHKSVWPETGTEDWCGEAEPKETKPNTGPR